MGRQLAIGLYVLAMVAIVVTVDIVFLRHHVLTRLLVNVGIVLVFAAVAALFFRSPRRP